MGGPAPGQNGLLLLGDARPGWPFHRPALEDWMPPERETAITLPAARRPIGFPPRPVCRRTAAGPPEGWRQRCQHRSHPAPPPAETPTGCGGTDAAAPRAGRICCVPAGGAGSDDGVGLCGGPSLCGPESEKDQEYFSDGLTNSAARPLSFFLHIASSAKRGKPPPRQPTVRDTCSQYCSNRPLLSVNLSYTGKRICFRRLLSNADAGTKRRSRLIWRAARPAV